MNKTLTFITGIIIGIIGTLTQVKYLPLKKRHPNIPFPTSDQFPHIPVSESDSYIR